MSAQIRVPKQQVATFCMRWRIASLYLFGSVLRDDFSPTSDVDVLVTFEAGEQWNLLDFVTMREELSDILGREVDLAEEKCLRNPFRRREILRSRELVYAA